jgi:hypothetical protein
MNPARRKGHDAGQHADHLDFEKAVTASNREL